MTSRNETAVPAGPRNGGKGNSNDASNRSHTFDCGTSTFSQSNELVLWPSSDGARWGVLAVGDSGGGMITERLSFQAALREAIRLSAGSRDYRDAPIRIDPWAAAVLHRYGVAGCA